MPGLDPKVAVHHLSVKKGARPVKQGQRRFRPELIPLIEGEVNKLIEVGFIREVKYPMWISSIVPVRKKNGQIRVCVDFRDLNNACPKDDFPLPIAELMIDATTGHEALSFMDGSSGYNQIRMAPADEELTAFRTPKADRCQPFSRLMKKDVPFQWDEACDKAFKSIKSYLMKPPVLVAPVPGRPLILYVAAQERSVGILLAQKNDEGKENALYYLSRR
ncbi:UNVERIFIED_CONTAM: Transposon Tf2-11 polyprotein [Sesamum calycinum]|uniref:Transposon Tf2-11 polyprotein n=1 Tax=Sesamum calycinum TaxID=2727403 RepID=A0AAW2JTV0_9LAMI